jgi:EAL domain-containing protein (putative c-di-GMP-specific phosphodiesterase class I)
VLRDRLRATDALARVGGCQFGILLPEASAAHARGLAGELVAAVARAAGAPAAAGIACFPDGVDRPAGALLADADAALAAAYGAVPPVAQYDGRSVLLPRHASSPAERLRRALAAGDLLLDREAVVDVRTGATDHHALAPRLRGAQDDLLACAERFGLGRAIDRRAVETALAGDGHGALVVPIGAGAATDRGFADWFLEALSGTPSTGRRLVLAVPERSAADDLAAVRALAARVGEFGVRLALDRFGGLGALTLLNALPVHQVRLDPALVHALPTSDRDRAVMLALVHAAEALGAETVALGVDRPAELTAVRGFGIGLAQGAHAAGS